MKEDHLFKKISSYDKYQAFRRKPSYRKDYWEFFSWCREHGIDEDHYLDYPEATDKAEALCKKYGITYLCNPSENVPEFWERGLFIEEKEIVEVIYPTECRYLTENEIEKGIRPRFLPIPVFDNGHEFSIKIDLTADTGSIIEYFIEQLKYFKSFLPKNKSRMAQDRMVNKWEVWDAYNETKSFEKAVKRLNDRADRKYELLTTLGVSAEAYQKIKVSTARKAYYRAFALVQGEKFDPSKHKPGKLPLELRRTCDQCQKYSTCEALCPEALQYVDQDKRYQRETTMPPDTLEILSSPRSHLTKPRPTIE